MQYMFIHYKLMIVSNSIPQKIDICFSSYKMKSYNFEASFFQN